MSLESIGLNWDKVDAFLACLQFLALAMPFCGLIASAILLFIEIISWRRTVRLNKPGPNVATASSDTPTPETYPIGRPAISITQGVEQGHRLCARAGR